MVSFARINPTPLTTCDRLGRTLIVTDQRGVDERGRNLGSVPRFSGRSRRP
jgi:hypothetical protein